MRVVLGRGGQFSPISIIKEAMKTLDTDPAANELALIAVLIRERQISMGNLIMNMSALGYSYPVYMKVFDEFVQDKVVMVDWRTYVITFNE